MNLTLEIVQELADLFWEKAAPLFKDVSDDDRSEAKFLAEQLAQDFLAKNPWLWVGLNLDPDEVQVLVEEIAEQMP